MVQQSKNNEKGDRSLPLFRSRPCYEAACSTCLLATQRIIKQGARAWALQTMQKYKIFLICQEVFKKNIFRQNPFLFRRIFLQIADNVSIKHHVFNFCD